MTDYKKILLNRWEESNKQILLQKELERITNELNREPIKNKEPDSFTQVFSNQDIREIIMKKKKSLIDYDKFYALEYADWSPINTPVFVELVGHHTGTQSIFNDKEGIDISLQDIVSHKNIDYLTNPENNIMLGLFKTKKPLPPNLEKLCSISRNGFYFKIQKVIQLGIGYYWGVYEDILMLKNIVNKFDGYKKLDDIYAITNEGYRIRPVNNNSSYYTMKPTYEKWYKGNKDRYL